MVGFHLPCRLSGGGTDVELFDGFVKMGAVDDGAAQPRCGLVNPLFCQRRLANVELTPLCQCRLAFVACNRAAGDRFYRPYPKAQAYVHSCSASADASTSALNNIHG